MTPRILVVYYSRTGNTRKIASELAAALNGDLDEISDFENRSGILGYLRSGRQAFWRKVVPLRPPRLKPDGYDLVVVGTPIWNVSLPSPVRAYLREHRRVIRAAAFFCTCGGMGMERVFQQMSDESGLSPVARLVVLEAKLGTPEARSDMGEFVDHIRQGVPTTATRAEEHAVAVKSLGLTRIDA